MFTITDPTLSKDIKAGLVSPAELAKHLLSHYTVMQLATALADYIIDNQNTKPIPISEEVFNAHFRIIGYRLENGVLQKETRGRKSVTKECD